MITNYNRFIREEAEQGHTRSRNVSIEEAAGIVLARCPQFDPKTSPLYFRGRWNTASTGCVLTDPAGFNRKSLSGFAHYNMLLDNLPNWQAYPKRDKSIMFLNDEFSTADYGTPFIVFPLDSPTIAVTPKPDIFDAFVNLRIKTNLSITELSDAMKFYKVRVTSWQDMRDDMDRLWLKLLRGDATNAHSRQVDTFNVLCLKSESWLDLFMMLLDPASNGFALVKYDGQDLSGHDERASMSGYRPITLEKYVGGEGPERDDFMPSELWAATTCLMVENERADELLAALNSLNSQ